MRTCTWRRRAHLGGLPAAHLDGGSAEVFRGEAVEPARRLWAAGGDAGLHVWSGGFHASDTSAPHAVLAQGMVRTRNGWMEKLLAD